MALILYDIGDLVRITGTFTTLAGAAQDPTTVSLVVTNPAGVSTTYTYALAEVTKSATGVYYKDVSATSSGTWLWRWVSTGTGQAGEEGEFEVRQQATSGMNYCTVDELLDWLAIEGTEENAKLELAIGSASRMIDRWTFRRFYAATETRYQDGEDGNRLFLDEDLLTVTMLKTDEDGDRTYETTWAVTDWETWPYNKTPKLQVRTTPEGLYSFPTGNRTIEIAGSWGYCTAANRPYDIRMLAVKVASRLFKEKDAGFTMVMGNMDLGEMKVLQDLDQESKRTIEYFTRHEVH